MLNRTGLHLESEQYLRWGIHIDICLILYKIITNISINILDCCWLNMHYGTFISSHAQTLWVAHVLICLHKGRMALKGLLNSIVHSNSNKAALVHSWPLTRVYISIPYLSWWTRGQIWCIYIYIHTRQEISAECRPWQQGFSDTKLCIWLFGSPGIN